MKSLRLTCLLVFLLLSCSLLFFQRGLKIRPPYNTQKLSQPQLSQPLALTETKRAQLNATYGKLPLSFEANVGQTDHEVKFLARGSGYQLSLTPSGATLHLQNFSAKERREKSRQAKQATQVASVQMKLVGASPDAPIGGREELPGKSHYFIGNDPTKWRTNVPHYAKVEYREVYPGVNLVYYGNQRQLEYDFVVAPGADPRAIRLSFEGADKIELDRHGQLVLQVAGGKVAMQKPVVYQELDGARQEVAGGFVLEGHQVRFRLGEYDASKPLVIDPVLVYSTYLGGSSGDNAEGIAVDASGSAYVTGWTDSTNFPTASPFQASPRGGIEVYVTKLNPSGSALIYSTYLGGNDWDFGFGIAVDASGNAYVTGRTDSANFPVINPFQATRKGTTDAFVTKLNPTGSALLYSTYLGGTSARSERGLDIAVDASGSAYVTGFIESLVTPQVSDFPTANPFQATLMGTRDAFVTKFNSAGSALVYSTYLGGSSSEEGRGIAVDAAGNAYVTGITFSSNFPVANALRGSLASNNADAFVTKFNPAGAALVYSTYLGGSDRDGKSGRDEAYDIAIDPAGNAYVTGTTESADFPLANPLVNRLSSTGTNSFVTKINSTGSAFVYSTYLRDEVGGATCRGIAADAAGNAYVTGQGRLPVVNPLPDSGNFGAFVAKLNPVGSALIYSTHLGPLPSGASPEGRAIAVDQSGNAYVTGNTSSTNFPTKNPVQANLGGTQDAFICKIGDATAPPPPACKPDLPEPGNLPPSSSSSTSKPDQARLSKLYSQLPLSFEANQGQTDSPVKFLSHGYGYGLFLTPTEAVLALHKQKEDLSATLRMKFVAANPAPQVVGRDKLPGQSNYFTGSDPRQWHTEVANYAKVEYLDVYPGVDLVYYGKQRQLEYDLIVAPGADPKTIKLAFEGAEKIEIDGQGDLVLHTRGGELRQHKPVTYQEVNGVRKPVQSRYVRKGKYEVGFQVASYDRRQPLIIDPMLSYSTFLGGGDSDEGFGIAVDAQGNSYVTGRTFSARSFPVKNGFQTQGQGSFDAFVTKLDPSKAGADSLVYSTFLGGGDSDEGFGIAVDAAGNAYVTGRTFSARGFPIVKAVQSQGQGSFDAFVTKLNAAGNGLLYSTFLGGGDSDEGFSIAVDGAGNAYVTGRTFSARGYPVRNAIQSEGQGSFDAFVTKLNTNPTNCTPGMIGRVNIECQESFLYSTFLGGGDSDEAFGIAVDGAGNAYVTGRTFSARGFPVRNAIQSEGQGSYDAFMTKLNTSPATCTSAMIGRVRIECQESFLYSTFLGGGDSDEGYAVAVDGAGNAHVTGRTFSARGFPVRNAIQSEGQGSFDAFVTKLNTSPASCTPATFGRVSVECQESFLYSTFLGGGDDEVGCGIALDTLGNAYVTGRTFSARGFPALYGFQTEGQGSFDAFVTKLKTNHTTCTPGSLERISIECKESLLYSTFLGGGDSDEAYGIAVDADDGAHITGRTFSARGFPTRNAFQAQGQGSFDAFVAKLTSGLQIPKSLNFGGVALGDTKELPLIIRNIDNRRLVINSLASSAAREFTIITPGAPFTLEAGQQQIVTLRFTPLAQGVRTATLRIDSDNPGRPVNDVQLLGGGTEPGAATIELSLTSLDFGSIATGQSKDLTLTVRNTGQANLTLNPSGSSNPRFKVIAPALPVTIAPNSQQTITVRFSPSAPGTQTGTLTLNSNAANNPSLAITLNGAGVGRPDIVAEAGSLDFGNVNLGQTITQTLRLNNPGSANLSVYTIHSSHPSFFMQPNLALPLTIPAGQSITIPISFKPTSVGVQTATLLIASNATDKATLAIQARGETPSEVLSTDDGTAETGALADGLVIVNRLTPSRYPATLRSLRFYFTQFQGLPSPVGEQIRLVVFADPTGSEQPPANPTLLVNQLVTIPMIPANGGFIDFPISAAAATAPETNTAPDNLTIESGDLYIGFQAPRPARGVVFAADSNGPQQQRAFISMNDGVSYARLTGIPNQQGMMTPVNIMLQANIGGVGTCTYAINPNAQAFSQTGGQSTVTVTTQNGCAWTASSNSAWISFPANGSSNTGSGMVNFSVATGNTPRQAIVTIAGQSFTVAQAEQVASVSSASYQRLGLAGEAIAAAFGTTLATSLQSATSIPLPTSLAGTTVKVRDATGVELFAPLFFVSADQLNFLMPAGLAPGTATVTVTNSNGVSAAAAVLNDVVAPGLFTANANGQGVAAAVALRIKANGAQSYETIARFDTASQRFVSTPLDLGPADEQVFLLLFGTGLRGRSSLAGVAVLLGGVNAEVSYAGAQGDLVGLDQVNVAVPRSLAGRGEIDILLTVDGRVANIVRVNIK